MEKIVFKEVVNKRGISLITLVITIIIMIILAGAIIITLSNTGIFDKANDAVSKYNLKEVQLIANLAWSEAYAGGARDKTSLQTAVDDALEKNDLQDKYEAIADEKGVIVTEIVNGSEKEPVEYDFMVGEIVKVKDTEEYFYVIENSEKTNSNVLLFSERLINPKTLLQISEGNHETYYDDAVNIAESYGAKLGGTGRLLTSQEAVSLKNIDENLLTFIDEYENCYYKYWLDNECVMECYGNIYDNIVYDNGDVRAVIDISKEKIIKAPSYKSTDALNFGEEVRIGSAIFYVISECDEEEQYVEIWAKYGPFMQFSSSNYWSSIEGITYPYDLNESNIPDETHYALRYAYDYGVKFGGTGRLLTYEEALDLEDWLTTIYWGVEEGSREERKFWLSSAGDDESIWEVWTGCEDLGFNYDLEEREYGKVYTTIMARDYGQSKIVWDEGMLEYVEVREGGRDVRPVIRLEKTKLSHKRF